MIYSINSSAVAQEAQAFWTQFTRENADAGGVSTGAIETRDESGLDRVQANAKEDGDRRGRRLGCQGGEVGGRYQQGHWPTNEIGRQYR
jgi:hypothetical protein